jgi:hypothetical protein
MHLTEHRKRVFQKQPSPLTGESFAVRLAEFIYAKLYRMACSDCNCTGVSGVTGEKGPTGDSGEYNKNIFDVTFANGIGNDFCESNLLAASAANADDQTDATTLRPQFPALFPIVQDP